MRGGKKDNATSKHRNGKGDLEMISPLLRQREQEKIWIMSNIPNSYSRNLSLGPFKIPGTPVRREENSVDPIQCKNQTIEFIRNYHRA